MSSAFGVGMLAGGLLLSVWDSSKRRMATSVLGTLIISVGRLTVGLAPEHALWLAIAGQGLTGLGLSAHLTGMRAAEQAAVAPEVQGRFFAVDIPFSRPSAPSHSPSPGPWRMRWACNPSGSLPLSWGWSSLGCAALRAISITWRMVSAQWPLPLAPVFCHRSSRLN